MSKGLRRKIRRMCYSKPDLLWRRYVLGFLFIFATISVSHWSSLATIEAAEDDTEVLSVSSRQRMLSQRILFLMEETDRRNDIEAERRLEAALDLFESSHNWLIRRPDLSPELQHLYFDKEPISLDAFSRRFVGMVGIVINSEGAEKEELHQILADWGKDDLVAALATANNLFRQESEMRISRLQKIQQVTLIAALVVLLIEALVIFLPAQMSVNEAIRRLERRKLQLHNSLQKLKQRNADLLLARKNLLRAAHHDALTGLMNRRAIYDSLGSGRVGAKGANRALSVLKLDLDLFKSINDTLGHNAGDRVLVHVAKSLNAHSNPTCTPGRLGGDEFVLIIDKPSSVADIETLAEQIIADIRKPILVQNTRLTVSASIGFTLATSSDATPDQMLIEADLALYAAKRAGRGLVRAYSTDLAQEIETRRTLFNEITQALALNQFEPYLQPQVLTHSGELYGCEVLARWRHPERGIIPPATFIAAAEEAGLIDQIDHLMVERGLDLLEDFDAQGLWLPSISVNASPDTLRDPHLPDRLLQEVRARHLSPERLTVEVLESTLIESDDDLALTTIRNLSRCGFSVVLDDFGTGYASMSNLSRLQLDGIKLDQSLIKPVPDPRADSIIQALVSLSGNLDMRVVAEGVETAAHFETVQRLGCDVVQGYGISRPMPADQFPLWYASYKDRENPFAMSA